MPLEQNKAVVRRYWEDYHNGRNYSIAPDILTPERADAALQATERIITAFPDYRVTVDAEIAEDDIVVSVWTGRGTHTGEWASPVGPIPPTGKQIVWTATTTLRIEAGKIAEVIASSWDHLGILQQMGALASAAPRTGA